MIPITPSGTRTREIRRPLGRVQSAMTSPTGSGRSATSSRPFAIPSIRASSRARRSSLAPLRFDSRAAVMSAALASSMSPDRARISAAAACRAAFLASVDARPRAEPAARAACPRRVIRAPTSSSSVVISAVSMALMLASLRCRRCRGSTPGRHDGSSRHGHGIPTDFRFHGFCAP